MYKFEMPKKEEGEALTELLESVASKERAIAHFINIEVEKTQKFMNDSNLSSTEVIDFQRGMISLMKNNIKMQMLLQFKLEDVLEAKIVSDQHQRGYKKRN